MNEEETREILDNMSEQELNDFIFFALQEVEKENQKLKTELEKKDIDIIETKEANRQLSIELQKKDRMINEMAYYLSDFDIDEMCEKCERCIGNGCYADDDMEFKINCIKQYFERKVENGN